MAVDTAPLLGQLDQQEEMVENLPAFCLAYYRSAFHTAVARGEARSFVLPYSVLGPVILPVLYLCIPHRKRPWLHQARWAVAVLAAAMNLDLITNGTSSTNMLMAYLIGCMAAWGMIWGMAVLLVLNPQFDVARVRRRKTNVRKDEGCIVANGHGGGDGHGIREKGSLGDRVDTAPIDESMAMMQGEYDHYWQYYPEDASFSERLGWVLDLNYALRGVGWNSAIAAIPHPPPPLPGKLLANRRALQLVNFSATPIASSNTGRRRCLTYRSFILNRLFYITTTYLIIDLFTILARRDPYFTLGPDYPPAYLPPSLSSLHPHTLSLLRTLVSGTAFLASLVLYLDLSQLTSCVLLGRYLDVLPSASELWRYPSSFGSLTLTVLDHGLAGFWGGFWHQTLRLGFTAPVRFLSDRGYITSPRTRKHANALGAFAVSSFLHAAGAHTTIPSATRAHYPFLFFLGFSLLGVHLQRCLACYIFRPLNLPRALRRGGNFFFAFSWLCLTRWAFVDDLARSGLFLLEPVPLSLVRLLGSWGVLGPSWKDSIGLLKGDENWWRWDAEYFPRWVWGRDGRWWESGLRL